MRSNGGNYLKKKSSAINIKQPGDFRDETQQDALIKWIVDKADEFAKVFRKYL